MKRWAKASARAMYAMNRDVRHHHRAGSDGAEVGFHGQPLDGQVGAAEQGVRTEERGP